MCVVWGCFSCFGPVSIIVHCSINISFQQFGADPFPFQHDIFPVCCGRARLACTFFRVSWNAGCEPGLVLGLTEALATEWEKTPRGQDPKSGGEAETRGVTAADRRPWLWDVYHTWV